MESVDGKISTLAHRIADSVRFKALVFVAILLGAAIVGLEAVPSIAKSFGGVLRAVDGFVLTVFAIEVVLKVTAAGRRPMRYFGDPWNLFDFTITVVCLLPLSARFAQVLRLARVARSLRLIKALPRLQLIVGALLRSLPSFGWVTLLLFLLLYAYSVMGVALFGANDPDRFGSLWTSILTMFGILTLEGWVDIMNDQIRGIAGADGSPPAESFPFAAPLFFLSFILTGTMVFLNLLVGVIVNSLSEGAIEEEMAEAKAAARAEAMKDTKKSARAAAAQADARATQQADAVAAHHAARSADLRTSAAPATHASHSPLPTLHAPDSGDSAHPHLLAERLARLEQTLDATLAELRAMRQQRDTIDGRGAAKSE